MRAYECGISKEEFVNELRKHQEADKFRQGKYWTDKKGGRGCSVGCSIESVAIIKGIKVSHSDHTLLKTHLGIAEWLSKLQDAIFEEVSTQRAKLWPVEFSEAIPENVDLEQTKLPIIVMLLEHTLASMGDCKFDRENHLGVVKVLEGSKEALIQMIEAYKSGVKEEIESATESVSKSAKSATESSIEAYRSAGESGWSTDGSAVWFAADSALSASKFARFATESATESIAVAASWSAWSYTLSSEAKVWVSRPIAYEYYADKVLEILRKAK